MNPIEEADQKEWFEAYLICNPEATLAEFQAFRDMLLEAWVTTQ